MKKLLFLSFLAASLIAGQYAKLKDGTIIILKDDGTWEKIETIPQGAPVTPTPVQPQSHGATPPPPPRQAPVAPPAPTPKPVVDPLAQEYAQKLQGVWESFDGSLKYIIKGNEATLIDGRKKRTGTFKIQSVKPDKREFILNIGEVGAAGYFSFGGVMRKLVFSPDFKRLTDYSASMPTELHKR